MKGKLERINFRCLSATVRSKVTLSKLKFAPNSGHLNAFSFKREIASFPFIFMSKKEEFLKIIFHQELSSFFGLSYDQLSSIIYRLDNQFKYHKFLIPKKNSSSRQIASPCKRLKEIQVTLKDVLYDIYPSRPSTHGFARNKSIVTNAESHLDKKYIFNIDLKDFFNTIHFGRVRNLFRSEPFNFNHNIATILAQICCFENSLPQGAPTSPIISNMIAWKLDAQLQHLAKRNNCTYSRYADDISFSFTCSRNRLPHEVLSIAGDEPVPSKKLIEIIEHNGFQINEEKVRFCSQLSRMEVTGLTVNQFVNVKRSYIKQIGSMLYAWEKFGEEAAEIEYNAKYKAKLRASDKPVSFLHVVMGKLAFLRSVRGARDPIFNKLATRFNNLVDVEHRFKIIKISNPEKDAVDALWVIEAQNGKDVMEDDYLHYQGTAFQLSDGSIVTCAHVVLDKKKKLLDKIHVFKHTAHDKKYNVEIKKLCSYKDIAVFNITPSDKLNAPKSYIEISDEPIKEQEEVKLMGYPAYADGHFHFIRDSKVARKLPKYKLEMFEISDQIREGNSGGPILNSQCKAVGVALEGAHKDGGHNACLVISELESIPPVDKSGKIIDSNE